MFTTSHHIEPTRQVRDER